MTLPHLTRRRLLALCAAGFVPTPGDAEPRSRLFLQGMRHAWCPYALPAETTLDEIEAVAKRGFDAVGVSFVGPYEGGKMDFARLDEAVTQVARYKARTVLHLAPRFGESDHAGDTLHDGAFLPHVWNRNPNYSVADIFDPRQRALFRDYLSLIGQRYGGDKRVAGFALGWGYMGETGFFIGDFLTDFSLIGATSAGYSEHALREFNAWRKQKGLSSVRSLPLPSAEKQNDDYIAFLRFRSEWIRDVFHRQIVAAVKAHTNYPVGIFGYIAADPKNYARGWSSTPNADFYRSAGSASSFDMTRTLIDSGVGWEDNELHDGKWDFTAACMQRDEARQIARGGVFHAMHVRVYKTEPQWEPDVYDKVCAFLKSETVSKRVKQERPTVALYQPTWGMAALPGQSAKQPFLPRHEHTRHLSKMIGLAESFGLPYRIITEVDLLEPKRLREFRHMLVPLWDVMPRITGEAAYRKLAEDKRVIGLPMKEKPYTRTEFRQLLKQHGVTTRLDFEAEGVLAGRTRNLVYNWSPVPLRVRVPEQATEISLSPHQFLFVAPIGKAESA